MTREILFYAIVVASVVLLRASGVLLAGTPKPAVLMFCETGGAHRTPGEGHIASGGNCVLHDAAGATVTAESISVYDNGEGP